MSDVRTLALALILTGLTGAFSMAMYLVAYKHVAQGLIPVSHRRRVLAWRRCAPGVLVVSVGATVAGLVLLMITALLLI
ncbi:MAG TPA: hypothetical protein VG247_27375 [Pseudonocardiaceae bacterium]|jgi:hypothetical protein|nr:hypothetical protein [Pseudonocardiaceae bacterium]